MLRPLPLLLIAALALPGCARLSQSRLNPLNWFGPSQSAAAAPVPAPRATTYDLRVPVADVVAMAVEPTESGAILRATGTMPGAGWFNAALVRIADEGGTVTYEFRAEAPPAPGAGLQTITVARALSDADLAGTARIRVTGATNSREARR
ncbi:MAG: hypothetical protein IT542_00155 [Rubellimicrobium sp.]|nr:hypothetical protein [Rubellimicrobium sp.]